LAATLAPPARRYLPLLALGVGAALFFGLGLHERLTFDALRRDRAFLESWVAANLFLAAALFLLAYAAAVVFLPPSGTVMTLAGGFIFGPVAGTVLAVVAATAGATVLFLAARNSVGAWLHERAGPFLARLEKGFKENELSYMLVLRLVPLFPFWLVNLAPAFLGVSLRSYVIGTFVGIIPGAAVYATVGAGLGSVFDRHETFSIAALATPEVLLGLSGLGLLALIPIAYKAWKGRAR
jgi:uncharacterized membrane protein YdjX (TVP38/TMEM64 family)